MTFSSFHHKSTLWSSVLLVLCYYFSYGSSFLHHYGCKFLDNDYRLDMVDLVDPVLGLNADITPVYIDNIQNLTVFRKALQDSLTNVLSTNILDNMPEMSDFYSSYVQYVLENGMHVIKFYEECSPAYKENTAYDLVLSVLNGFVEKNPNFFKSVYLITAESEIGQEKIDFLKSKDRLHKTFKNNHVAGAVRIMFANRAWGNLVVDPALGVPIVSVIMDDGTDYDQITSVVQTTLDGRKPIKIELLPKSQLYFAFMERYDSYYPDKKVLYYLQEPYCSFVVTYTKVNLLSSDRYSIRYNHLGYPTAAASYSMTPDVANNTHFYLSTFTGYSSAALKTRRVPFELGNLESLTSINLEEVGEEVRKIVRQYLAVRKLLGSQIASELVDGGVISREETFLSDMITLEDHMNTLRRGH